MALNSLIRGQFPQDTLYILGFSDYAREISPEMLPRIDWSEYVYGTNMQHGFMVARQLLARHKGGTRQIILITDGEPTAHLENGRVHFAYPPTYQTIRETLKEVMQCTREGITINTFMLERSRYLTDFVNQMTRAGPSSPAPTAWVSTFWSITWPTSASASAKADAVPDDRRGPGGPLFRAGLSPGRVTAGRNRSGIGSRPPRSAVGPNRRAATADYGGVVPAAQASTDPVRQVTSTASLHLVPWRTPSRSSDGQR